MCKSMIFIICLFWASLAMATDYNFNQSDVYGSSHNSNLPGGNWYMGDGIHDNSRQGLYTNGASIYLQDGNLSLDPVAGMSGNGVGAVTISGTQTQIGTAQGTYYSALLHVDNGGIASLGDYNGNQHRTNATVNDSTQKITFNAANGVYVSSCSTHAGKLKCWATGGREGYCTTVPTINGCTCSPC